MIDRHITNKKAYMKIIKEIKSKKLEQGTFMNMKATRRIQGNKTKKKKCERKETTNCFTDEK